MPAIEKTNDDQLSIIEEDYDLGYELHMEDNP